MKKFFNDDFKFNKWEMHMEMAEEIELDKEEYNEDMPEEFLDRLLQ